MGISISSGYESYSTLRVERHQIKPSNKHYKLLNELCFRAKNIYNSCLYEERQTYFDKSNNISYLPFEVLYSLISSQEVFSQLPSYFGTAIIRVAASTFKGFIKATNDYYNNPEKYKGRPRIPKYKDSIKGRCPLTLYRDAFRFSKNSPDYISFHKALNNFKVKTHLNPEKHELKVARFIPKKNFIILEIVYETSTDSLDSAQGLKYPAGIDIGIDNFSAISIFQPDAKPLIINGKGLKSYNKNFNRILGDLKSEAMRKHKLYTTKRIQQLLKKRNNYIDTWVHKASRITANYLYENKVRYVIIGKNKNWKQNSPLSKKVNQTFIQIPYEKYIQQVIYKCQDLGMVVYLTEESYTSGTSFLDNETPTKEFYNKNRRVHRGLFRTTEGKLINADVNAGFQIIKKVFGSVDFRDSYHLKLNPIRVNVA